MKKPCFFTFDQPLYIKATCEIVTSTETDNPVSSVIVRQAWRISLTNEFFRIHIGHIIWAGLPTYVVIEQCLIKGIKSIGGLTRGRGVTNNTLMRSVICGPICSEVTEPLKNLLAPIMNPLSSLSRNVQAELTKMFMISKFLLHGWWNTISLNMGRGNSSAFFEF